MIYLRTKPEDEFDGTEEYVFRQYLKRKTHWAPIGVTKFIKLEEDDDCEAKIDNLNANMKDHAKNSQNIINNLGDFKRNLMKLEDVSKKLKNEASLISRRVKHYDCLDYKTN